MPKGEHDGQRGTARTKVQRQLDIHEMIKQLGRGRSKKWIAKQFGVDPSTITYDWKQVLQERYIDSREMEEARGKVLLELEEIKAEVWDAWERSKEDGENEMVEEVLPEECWVCGGSGKIKKKVGRGRNAKQEDKACYKCEGRGKIGGYRKVIQTKTGRLPQAAYIAAVAKAIEQERDMLGLDTEKSLKLRMQGGVNVDVGMDWDKLWKRDRTMTSVEELEARIAAEEQTGQLKTGLKELAEGNSTNGNGIHKHEDDEQKPETDEQEGDES